MPKLSFSDLTYYKSWLAKARDYHEKQFLQRIDPDRIMGSYEGRKYLTQENPLNSSTDQTPVDRISLNKFFPSTATLVTTLYPQNPKFLCTPKRTTPQDELSAKVLSSAMNYYFEEIGAEQENQNAIVNAWFNGFGCVKQGWRTVTRQVNPPEMIQEPQGLMAKLGGMFGKPKVKETNMEQGDSDEYIEQDEPFLFSIDPRDILLDPDMPFNKGQKVAHRIKRSLEQIKTCGLYKDLGDNFYSSMRTKKDDREIELDLWELWCVEDGVPYVITLCDRWEQPLRYQRMDYLSEGLPFTFLALNVEPKVTYPISHGKIIQNAQREIDYILTLQLKHLDKHRNQVLVNEKALSESGKRTLENNKLGGVVYTNVPVTSGVYSPITTAPIPADMFNLQGILTNQLMELLTVTGARATGASELETATQEKIAEMGNQMRTAGMQKMIKSFITKQGKKLSQDLKQFATAPAIFKITGLNVQDPMTGQLITDKWVEFGTEGNPTSLKDAIQGDYDIDVSMVSTSERELPVIRKQLVDAIGLLSNPVMQQSLAMEGKKVRTSELVKDLLKTFDTLANTDKYLEDLPPPPMMPPQMPPMGPGGIPAPQPGLEVPSPEAIQGGVENVNVPQEMPL